eukprot:4797985-Pyramimonas_sp.AAC.2
MPKRSAAALYGETSTGRARRAVPKKPSAAAYIGYVEDDEDIGTSPAQPLIRFALSGLQRCDSHRCKGIGYHVYMGFTPPTDYVKRG